MKTEKTKSKKVAELIAVGIFTLMGAADAFAQERGGGGSTQVGRGGDVLQLPDDTIILADPFIKRSGVNFDLNPLLIEELKRIGTLYDAHFAEGTKFVDTNILDPLVEYRFLAQLPKDCHRITVDSIPAGSSDILAGCTSGSITWIREDLFKKMTIREQAKFILHERLRSNPILLSDEQIADIVVGTEEMLSLYQNQNNGARPLLTADQIYKIEKLQGRLIQAGIASRTIPLNPATSLDKMTDFAIHPQGGGMVQRGKFNTSQYIGIASKIDVSISSLGSNIEIINSDLSRDSKIGNGSIVTNTKGFIGIGENTRIENVSSPHIGAGNNSIVRNIAAELVMVQDNVLAENSSLGTFFAENATTMKNFQGPSDSMIHLHKGASISDVSVEYMVNRKNRGTDNFGITVGRYGELSNLTIKNTDPHSYLRLARGSEWALLLPSFATIPVYGVGVPLLAWTLYKLSNTGLKIPAHKKFDFGNSTVCGTGRFNINGYTRVESKKEFYRMCK